MRIWKISLRVLSILMTVGGIALFILAAYITSEVDKGEMKANKAQKEVNFVKKPTSGNKITKPIGDILTSSIQKEIDSGRKDIKEYRALARTLNILAICITSAGPILFVISFFPRTKKKGRK